MKRTGVSWNTTKKVRFCLQFRISNKVTPNSISVLWCLVWWCLKIVSATSRFSTTICHKAKIFCVCKHFSVKNRQDFSIQKNPLPPTFGLPSRAQRQHTPHQRGRCQKQHCSYARSRHDCERHALWWRHWELSAGDKVSLQVYFVFYL